MFVLTQGTNEQSMIRELRDSRYVHRQTLRKPIQRFRNMNSTYTWATLLADLYINKEIKNSYMKLDVKLYFSFYFEGFILNWFILNKVKRPVIKMYENVSQLLRMRKIYLP